MISNMMMYLICSVISLLYYCRYVQCNFDIPGETSPAFVEMEVGSSVNISCRMNPKVLPDRTVHDLYFINALSHQRVNDSDVVIVNETTIIYMLQNAMESKPTYRCMCGSDAIMETKVYVGHKPLKITNFNCRAYNYENMKCNFTKPINYVLTHYNVSYHFDLKAYKYFPTCDHEKLPFVTCTALGATHANENVFHYKIVGTNSLGTITQFFDVDYMSVLVLAAPGQNFSLRHVTANAATFSFRMKNPSKNLQWEVILQPKNMSDIILSPQIRPVLVSNNEFELSLKNLSYAYYEYQIRLRVRLSTVNNWSDSFIYWFRTEPRLPDRAPRTDEGAFETDPSEKRIRLYWEQLKPYEYNGNNFTYVVEQIGSEQSELLSLEMNSAVFLWTKEKQYEFAIRSQNHVGMSLDFTRIKISAMVPGSKRKLHTPPAVHDIYHESNGTLTLTWIEPKTVDNLVDYTVYWCRKSSLPLNSCEGSLHFQRVPRDIHKFTTAPSEHTLKLAVSANYINYNTGMHWTECTMAEGTDLVIMEPTVETISSTSIKIEWGSGKICPSIFEGYNLSYCAVDINNSVKGDTEYYNCTNNEPERHILISKTFKRWILQDLKPYTHYKIEMFMYSPRKSGRKSQYRIAQTWEDAPTPPLHLNVLHKSNTSVIISWMPPIEPNGLIRSYTVLINNKSTKVPPAINDKYGRVVHKIENLSSSTSYNVHVLAQTKDSLLSSPSNVISFKTYVGYPSMPDSVRLQDSKNDAVIEWVVPEGRTDFYEVAITLLKDEEVQSRRISIIMGSNSCSFPIPKCFDHKYRTTVEVRSVNAALLKTEVDEQLINSTRLFDDDDAKFYHGSDELTCFAKSSIDEKQKHKEMIERYNNPSIYRLYKSKWQLGPLFNCAASTLGTITLYIFLATFFAVFLLITIYFLQQKYNKMANINCTLPAALDAYMTKDFSGVGAVLSHNFITFKENVISTQDANVAETFENKDSAITQHISPESLAQNEEHCLLEATSQNSLLMGEQQPQFIEFSQQREPQRHHHMYSKFIENQRFDEINPPKINKPFSDSTYVQASDFLNGVMPSIPAHNFYVKPNAIADWQSKNQNRTESLNSPVGYVSPDSIAMILPKALRNDTEDFGLNNAIETNSISSTNTDDFNESPMLPSTPKKDDISASNFITSNSNGYTTVDQLAKMATVTPVSNTQEIYDSSATAAVKPPISGYVTQQELTAYGQQQKNIFY